MTALQLALCFASALLPVGLAAMLVRRMRRDRWVPLPRIALVTGLGALGALFALFAERWVLTFTGLSLEVEEGHVAGAVAAMLLLAAPLEEAVKVAAVWPLYMRQRITSGRMGITYAVCTAAGFSAVENALMLGLGGQVGFIELLRVAIAVPAHLFFAGLWGYTLGGRGSRDYWFGATWVAATLLRGVYDHIVFGRGPAVLVVVVPLLVLIALVTWVVFRETGPNAGDRSSLLAARSVGSVRQAMQTGGQPLKLHWIAIGSLVTIGVVLVFLAAAVYVGHRWGVDFAAVDEGDLEATVPLVLLGTALLAAFPVSGYLIARASGARSVLEPAWATGAAIAMAMALLSVTEPLALVVALSVAPVAFLLACAGAWFGLSK